MSLVQDHWLSQVLAKKAWRLDAKQSGWQTHFQQLVQDSQPTMVYTKVPSDQLQLVAEIEAAGFHLIDTNVTLRCPCEQTQPVLSSANVVRSAMDSDRDSVMVLAASTFTFSRFHLDPCVSKQQADNSRASWAGNYFTGERGDDMLLIEQNGVLAGFMQLLHPAKGQWVIDLIGVSANFQRQGIATDLIQSLKAKPDCEEIIVGTQVSNIPSLRLYEQLGFRVAASQYVFHYHGASSC